MSETLALETQLLLQEVTQAKQFEAAANDAADVLAPPALSEFEAAKQALVDKLRKKKEANRQQQQKLFVKRYGFSAPTLSSESQQETPPDKAAAAPPTRVSPSKAKRMVRLPVTASASAGSRQKKDLLSQLRTKAINQGGQEMAKLFGYKSYEEQIKELNKKEKKIILENALAEAGVAKQTEEANADAKDEDSSSDFVAEADDANENEEEEEEGEEAGEVEDVVMEDDAEESVQASASTKQVTPTVLVGDHDDQEETQDLEALEAASRDSVGVAVVADDNSGDIGDEPRKVTSTPTGTRRRRNHITVDEDDDGNEADSEEDGKGEEEDVEDEPEQKAPRDKAAAFRQLLQAEAKQERKRKRLRQGENFVESEADEDEEEDVLKIGGLGDFGFGVPQAASKDAKEAEEERNALKMREDDLEGIVDDLSDEERDQAQDLDEIYRRELEEQDRQQVKEVMRNVKEGFGRNRRAFSGLNGGSGARGRFDLNQLVAADGDKLEAARLGLLESDEDMSGKESEEEGDASKKDGEAEEEDEEAEMERVLRERYTNQPKIYITSSESENEDENEVEDDADEAVKEEIESDEERERQQMKLFSERARINRRMQRMKDLQRQIAEEVEDEGAQKAPLPNILLEEDEDSQSLLKVLTRTDVSKKQSAEATALPEKASTKAATRTKSTSGAVRPKVGRFNSFGMGSAVRSTSSFSRVADNCKLFSAGSGTASTSKGFVFTSFSSDRADQADENAAPSTEDSAIGAAPSSSSGLAKSKSWGGNTASSRPAKRPFAASNGANDGKTKKKAKSDFFSVLASYQCVSQNSSSQQ